MKEIILAATIAALLALNGCGANFLSAKTEATYTISPDGKSLTYSSNKQQQKLHAKLSKDGALDVSVDESGTQESIVAAGLQQQIIMGEILKSLLPLIEKAAAIGATNGAAGPFLP